MAVQLRMPQVGESGFLGQMPFFVHNEEWQEGPSEFWEPAPEEDEDEEPTLRIQKPR